eukprot:gene17838-biopygen11118
MKEGGIEGMDGGRRAMDYGRDEGMGKRRDEGIKERKGRGVPRRPPRSSAELRGAPRSSAELRGGFPKELFRGGHVKDLRGAPRRSRERALPKELFWGTSTAEVFQKTSFESPPRSSAELRGAPRRGSSERPAEELLRRSSCERALRDTPKMISKYYQGRSDWPAPECLTFHRKMVHLPPENGPFASGRMMHLSPGEMVHLSAENGSFVPGELFIYLRTMVHLFPGNGVSRRALLKELRERGLLKEVF